MLRRIECYNAHGIMQALSHNADYVTQFQSKDCIPVFMNNNMEALAGDL